MASLKKYMVLVYLMLQVNFLYAGKYFEHKKIGDLCFKQFVESNNLYHFFYDTLGFRQYGVSYPVPFHVNEEVMCYYQDMFALSDGKYQYSYGDICALSGDHSADPLQLFQGLFSMNFYENPANAKKFRGLIEQLKHVRTIQNNAIEKGKNEASYFFLDYIELASNDKSHFQSPVLSFEGMLAGIGDSLIQQLDMERTLAADNNSQKELTRLRKNVTKSLLHLNNTSKYAVIHMLALDYINASATDYCFHDTAGFIKNFKFALIFNAYADHFLQDAFSAGHLPVKRSWRGMDNKGVHDYYSRNGIDVTDENGEAWRTYGDDYYDSTTFSHAMVADSVSIMELWQYFNQVRSQIAKAPGYIPKSQFEKLVAGEIPQEEILRLIHKDYLAYRYMPRPLGTDRYKRGIALKNSSKNGIFLEAGSLSSLIGQTQTIGWNIGCGLGLDFTDYKTRGALNARKLGTNRETVYWAGLVYVYSMEKIATQTIHSNALALQFTYLDRLLAETDFGVLSVDRNYFFIRPAIGYEYKKLKCPLAPALKLYCDLGQYRSGDIGLMLSLKLY